MSDDVMACPECAEPMRAGGFLLALREEDGRRACRTLWGCARRHVWWRWADRPGERLEACPVPQVFFGGR
ncbi:dehydrogenase [Streptomyces lichenis]|uniref:Dehydrogenase n=1 Tax=Streptomyces lichenis TaxID=2306967 RepID=A0ABT0I697_9ACTN|nr:dehydrogenase [Streptomyces lichenis]MCK8676849.1 dehydrogenase [Streptomyces lichenis]